VKILHFGDSHFANKRLDECWRNFEYMIEYGRDNGIDMFVCAGDLFDANTMIDSHEYNKAVEGIGKMSEIAPVVMIRGNHDPDGSLGVFERLGGINYKIYVFNNTAEVDIEDKNGNKVRMLLLPYVNPIIFNAVDNKINSIFSNAKEYYDDLIKTFSKVETEHPKVIVAHLSVYGAQLANSEKIVANEVMLSVDDLRHKSFDAVMLGHIHKRDQDIFIDSNIRYSGSHYRINYGEKNNEVGFIVWDISKGRTSLELINTPAKKMVEYHLNERQSKHFISTGSLPFEIDKDADIKVVADVKEGVSHVFDKGWITRRMKGGIGTVKIQLKTVPKTMVRAKDIGSKKTLREKVSMWLDVSHKKPTKSLLEKADLVEEISVNSVLG